MSFHAGGLPVVVALPLVPPLGSLRECSSAVRIRLVGIDIFAFSEYNDFMAQTYCI